MTEYLRSYGDVGLSQDAKWICTRKDRPSEACTMDNSSNICMDNSSNNSNVSPLSGPGFVAFNVVMLLAVVLPVITANTVILVALVLDSSTVKVVRLVLGSILVSCLIAALGLAMYHISGIILSLSPVNNPSNVPCTITKFLISFGAAARSVLMATFAIMVYIVKSGRDTKKHIFVAFLVAVAILWVLVFLGASPLFSQEIVRTCYKDSLSCGFAPTGIYSYVYYGLYLLFFGVVPLSVTIVFLVITTCFIKYHSFTDIKTKTATVKFGFFLLLSNGAILFGQLVCVLASIFITSLQRTCLNVNRQPTAQKAWVYATYILLNSALIPTPILIPIYFKPIRKQLWHWFCCCMLKKGKAINKSNTMEGSSGAHVAQKAMKEV